METSNILYLENLNQVITLSSEEFKKYNRILVLFNTEVSFKDFFETMSNIGYSFVSDVTRFKTIYKDNIVFIDNVDGVITDIAHKEDAYYDDTYRDISINYSLLKHYFFMCDNLNNSISGNCLK